MEPSRLAASIFLTCLRDKECGAVQIQVHVVVNLIVLDERLRNEYACRVHHEADVTVVGIDFAAYMIHPFLGHEVGNDH